MLYSDLPLRGVNVCKRCFRGAYCISKTYQACIYKQGTLFYDGLTELRSDLI